MAQATDNLARMIVLVDEVFAMRDDPEQLSIDDAVIERLRRLHPSALSEERNEHGPIAWMLVIPTTASVMERFLREELTERQLFEATPEGGPFDALYLCSALVLPEFRQKGLAKRLLLASVHAIMNDHPITTLFFWGFTDEGARLAHSAARDLNLPLKERLRRHSA